MKRSIMILTLSAILLSSYTAIPGQTSAATSTTQTVTTGYIENGVNLRSQPSTSGEVIGLVKKGSEVVVLDAPNSYFYKIQTENGVIGYISSSNKYISVTTQKVTSTVSAPTTGWTGTIIYGVNMRDLPSSSGNVIKFLSKGTELTILEQSNDYFYKVKTESGQIGYVSTNEKYIQVSGSAPAPAPAPAPVLSPTVIQQQIEQIISAGMKYLGTPYEYGSSRSTTTTFDCSDFTRQAFKDALGLILPSDSRQQGEYVQDKGTDVYDIASLKRGDLIFFMSYKGSKASSYAGIDKSTERITHTAIYLGDGKMLHTYSTESGGVKVDELDGSWTYRFLYGGSVLK